MRRALLVLLAAWLACAFIIGTQGHAFALTCPNPQISSDYEATFHYPPYVVQNDVWQQVGKQTMYACSASSWLAVANQTGPASDGVRAYPDSQLTLTDWAHCSSQPRINSFTKLHAALAMTTPDAGSWDTAYDVFLNGGVCGQPTTEVMVLPSWRNVDWPTSTRVTVNKVAYDFVQSTRFFQFRRVTQVASSNVNLLGLFRWLEHRGDLQAADTLQFVAGGVEILTTQGSNLPFSLTAFSVGSLQ